MMKTWKYNYGLISMIALAVVICHVSCTKPDVSQEEEKPDVEVPDNDTSGQNPPQEDEPVVDPKAPVLKINALTSTRACVRVDYSFEKVTEFNQNVNICFSKEPGPTIDDHTFKLPPRSANKADMMGVVPNLVLDYDTDYYFRLYVQQKGTVYYSNEVKCSLEDEYEPINLSWKKMDIAGLHPDITAYTTTSKLSGRNFQAWYAIADMNKGNLKVKANHPANAQTVTSQAASIGPECQILINSGYFYYEGNQAVNIGTSIVDGIQNGFIFSFAGSLSDSEPEESNTQYKVTRGVFGADAQGVPAVKWMGCITHNTNYYYDMPLLSIKGETKQNAPSATNPTVPSDWEPVELVTAGPVLLKDGKIPFDFTRTSKGNTYFLSNWEMITYDVFTDTTGDDWRCDRSAVGITEDGKLIFFACEGRTPSLSCGANLDEVARILKALGCVEALNFDGGGSTKLYLGGQSFANNNRAVMTTVGIVTK